MQAHSMPILPPSHTIAEHGSKLLPSTVRLPPVMIDPSSPTFGGHRLIPPLTGQDLMAVYPPQNMPSGPPQRERYFAAQEREFFTRSNNNSQTQLSVTLNTPSCTKFGESNFSHRVTPQSSAPSSPSSISSFSSLSGSSSPTSSGPSNSSLDMQARFSRSYERLHSPYSSSLHPSATPQRAPNPPTIYIHIPAAGEEDDTMDISPPVASEGEKRSSCSGRKQGKQPQGKGMCSDTEMKVSGVEGGKGFGVLMPPPTQNLRFVGVNGEYSTSLEGSPAPNQSSPMTFIPLAKKGSGAPGRGPTRRARRWF